jgi:hypothetical protein
MVLEHFLLISIQELAPMIGIMIIDRLGPIGVADGDHAVGNNTLRSARRGKRLPWVACLIGHPVRAIPVLPVGSAK